MEVNLRRSGANCCRKGSFLMISHPQASMKTNSGSFAFIPAFLIQISDGLE
jgi:hypothetical protein